MLKRILVLLDETPSSIAARQYAYQLAESTCAGVTGLAGIDLAAIEQPMPGTASTTGHMFKLEEQLKKQAASARNRLRETYERECQSHCVTFEWLTFDGDPLSAMSLATETRDLVITGHDTAFHGAFNEPLSEMLAKLLAVTPRPVIVCADEAPPGHEVLIAYDGSVPAMRAVQIFALLGIVTGQRVHVTSIGADCDLAARQVSGAATYLRSHGYDVEKVPIVSSAHPADILRIEVMDRKIGLVVMGAYGHRGLREFLFGSTTRMLVASPPCPLFVYH
jgi:nucleotide-binding universal stress UspA family protein